MIRARFNKNSSPPALSGERGHTLRKLSAGVIATLSLGLAYSVFVLVTGTSSPFLVVQGTSMEPTYHEGDLLLSRRVQVSDIRSGDVIAFKTSEDVQNSLRIPANVAHRVIEVSVKDGQLAFVTQGDNSDVDPFVVLGGDVHSVIVRNLGPLARPLLILRNPGLMVSFALPVSVFALLVIVSLRSSQDRKTPSESDVVADEITDRSATEIRHALKDLTEAVAEYGIHLKSHTAVMVNLAEATQELKEAAKLNHAALGEAVPVVGRSHDSFVERIIVESKAGFRDKDTERLAHALNPSGAEKRAETA